MLKEKQLHLIAFLFSLTALSISFYLSEGLKHLTSPLDWYQRMMFAPIFLITGFEIFRSSKHTAHYTLLFSGIGIFISFIHYLIQKTSLLGRASVCLEGENCYVYVEFLDFITIPLVNLVVFVIIFMISIYTIKRKQ